MYLTDLAIRIRMSNVSWERPQCDLASGTEVSWEGESSYLLSGHGCEAIWLKPVCHSQTCWGEDEVVRHHGGQFGDGSQSFIALETWQFPSWEFNLHIYVHVYKLTPVN